MKKLFKSAWENIRETFFLAIGEVQK